MTCPYETCQTSLRSSITPSGHRARTLILVSTVRVVATGRRALLILRLTPAFRRALDRALRRGPRGLTLVVRARDRAGNLVVRRVAISARR